MSMTRNMNVKVTKELYSIVYFPKYRHLDTGDFSMTLYYNIFGRKLANSEIVYIVNIVCVCLR